MERRVTISGSVGAVATRVDGRRQVVIIGGVAGGMSTATRLRRLDSDVNIVVLERSGFVSFANGAVHRRTTHPF
jgi:NADH dehydrogenase FAD-containing subunit